MAISAVLRGNPSHDRPILVCLPGMLGVPENFETMMLSWQDRFASVLVDLHPQNRDSGLADSEKSLSTVSYDHTADDIRRWLVEKFPGRTFWFLGVSIGGKIVFDFAARFPELYEGGVVTDVGLGSFRESELYRFVEVVIPSLHLEQDWVGIKTELRTRVPVNAVRVLMQTQIDYSPTEKRGTWKKAVHGLKRFLDMQKLSDQWDLLPRLARPTHILRAEHLSGISDVDYVRMKNSPLFQFTTVPGSAHLLHVTHPEWIERAVRSLGLPSIGVEAHTMGIGIESDSPQ